jgi:DNA repair protein RadC
MIVSLVDQPLPSVFACGLLGEYQASSTFTEEDILNAAVSILGQRFSRKKETFSNPLAARGFFKVRLATLQYEVFCVLFLDNQHRMIACEQMFRGTFNGASVYPREVVKRALELNAAAVIFSHNHPSGDTRPSQEDYLVTRQLIDALKLINVKVLDHIIVGGVDTASFAELGFSFE